MYKNLGEGREKEVTMFLFVDLLNGVIFLLNRHK